MASRKPLVLVNGQAEELPAGDKIDNNSLELKTINGQSIKGTGDIPVSGGGGSTVESISPFLLMGA